MQDAEETPEGESAQDFESEPGQGYLLELHFELDGRASTMRDKALRAHFMAELDAAGVLMRIDRSGRNLRKLGSVAGASLEDF